VTVDGFWIDATPVTNDAFARFVDETRYVTVAETPRDSDDYPDAWPELLRPGGLVFFEPPKPITPESSANCWTYVPGANWRHPRGPNSNIDNRGNHPVVQIAFADARAFCAWAGKTLPTEAEWEFAAYGGLSGTVFSWGDIELPDGQTMANVWHGRYPCKQYGPDEFEDTSPVGAFPPNGYGLVDMTGNVWEWTADWYQPAHVVATAQGPSVNPTGGTREESFDVHQPWETFPRKVTKGGSYLSSANYDFRYRPAARVGRSIDTASCDVGFRCIVRTSRSSSTFAGATDRGIALRISS
jgi:sulfatase modifying factor 1